MQILQKYLEKYTVNGLRLQANVASAVLTYTLQKFWRYNKVKLGELVPLEKETRKQRNKQTNKQTNKETKTLDEI